MPLTARHDSRLRDHDTQRIALEVMSEVAHIADAPATVAQRAHAVLESLRRVIPFEGSWLAVLGPERGEHHSLEQRGYDASTDAYLRSTGVLEDVEMTGINRAAAPICVRRLPVPPQELRVWADYLVPSGFREGGAIGLFADHRYLGMVAVHTDTVAHPTDGALDLLQLIAPVIARAVDPLRGISETAQVVHQAEAGIILTRDGRAHPLPGLARHPLLDADTPLYNAVAAYLARDPDFRTFLCPDNAVAGEGRYERISILPCDCEPPFYLTAAVTMAAARDLHGLSPHDLTVLGALVEPGTATAPASHPTQREVDARLPHIMATLHTRTREQAAARARRLGMYVPPALSPRDERARSEADLGTVGA
jgi:hypothetical protein